MARANGGAMDTTFLTFAVCMIAVLVIGLVVYKKSV